VAAIDSSHTILFVMDLRLPGAMTNCISLWCFLTQGEYRISLRVPVSCCQP
jgi:hypothetical protein